MNIKDYLELEMITQTELKYLSIDEQDILINMRERSSYLNELPAGIIGIDN